MSIKIELARTRKCVLLQANTGDSTHAHKQLTIRRKPTNSTSLPTWWIKQNVNTTTKTHLFMNIDVFWSRVNWLQALLQLHLPSYKRCTSIGFYSQGEWVSKNETGNSHPVPSIQVYSRINSIKFPASGADDFCEPRLMLQIGTLRKELSTCGQSERQRRQYSSAYVVVPVTWLKWEERRVCETRTEGCHSKWRGLCGCNPAITATLST